MKKHRVLHLNSNRWNSAITEYSISLLRALSEDNVDCLYVGLRDTPSIERASRYSDVKEVDQFSLVGFGALKRICQDFVPDSIITYGGSETFLARFLKTPKIEVIRFRGQAFVDSIVREKIRQFFSIGFVDKVILPSQKMEDELNEMLNLKTKTILLGIDTEKFRKKYEYSPTTRPTLLVFGRLDPIKGHREFLEIYKGLLDNWPREYERPLLKIIGEEKNLTKKMIEDAVLQNKIDKKDVEVITERVDAPEYLAGATLGVIPSLGSELICRVAQEFLCCGTPIVHSGVGSLDEVVLEDSVGSFSWGDTRAATQALKENLLAALDEKDQIRSLRADKACKRFSYSQMAPSFFQ